MDINKLKKIIKSDDLHNKLVKQYQKDVGCNNSVYCILENLKEIILEEVQNELTTNSSAKGINGRP